MSNHGWLAARLDTNLQPPCASETLDLCLVRGSMEAVRRHSGFADIRLGALGGWDASLAPMIARCVRGRPMATWKHEMLFALARPPASLDRYEMITGLSGAARRPAA